MKTLFTIAFATVLVLAASAAGAADLPQQSVNARFSQDNSHVMGSQDLTVLRLSPMYVEIQQVLDQAGETEQLLLKELAVVTEDEDAKRIIRRIESLEVSRTLAILKIQARYARLEGRWDEEYRLRARIVAVLENEDYAVK